jgi:hypothetical protein
MKIVVQRNGQIFGPYPLAIAQQYLAQGSLLPQDLAREDGNLTAQWQPLSRFLAQAGISVPPKGGGNTLSAAMQNLKSFDARGMRSLRFVGCAIGGSCISRRSG